MNTWIGATLFDFVLALVVQVLLARRIDELKRTGRALSAPNIFSGHRNNLPIWAFLLGDDHKVIKDTALTFYVWATRLLLVGFMILLGGMRIAAKYLP